MSLDKYTDFYELLQVHPKAGAEVIKKAYYTLMQQNHPDKGGSDDIAKKINEAYEILLDEKRRKEFDTERNLRLLEKMKSLTKTNEDKNKVKDFDNQSHHKKQWILDRLSKYNKNEIKWD